MRKRGKPPLWFEETFDRIRRFENEIFRVFDDFWRGFDISFPEIRIPMQEFRSTAVDVAETKDEIIVRADLPGFSKDEIKLKATEDALHIEAVKKEERKEEGENYFRQERRFGAVKRVVPLPKQVIPEQAKAKFENGVLEVKLPKAQAEEEEEKEIEIE